MSIATLDLDGQPPASTSATPTSLIRAVTNPAGPTRWEDFDRTYRGIVMAMARRAGLRHHDAEDLTQEVFRDLARSLCGFQVSEQCGSFRRYLFQLIRWRIASKFESMKRSGLESLEALEEQAGRDPLEAMAPEPPAAPAQEADFRAAVTEALLALARDLSPRDVELLDLYYCREWPARRISESLRMPVATVYVVAHRHKFRLCREILRRL